MVVNPAVRSLSLAIVSFGLAIGLSAPAAADNDRRHKHPHHKHGHHKHGHRHDGPVVVYGAPPPVVVIERPPVRVYSPPPAVVYAPPPPVMYAPEPGLSIQMNIPLR
ncbi:hypothetical protein [Azospirillum sp. SYSU D00513]|uniref:hypothetical protein n=1 Tax=Azospirillum sp. SYSU D00513 TaxID=2812561 RepID=UPI001A96BCFD|nr:hypothetical protein [Azospirillum sp. SYSU D00513]